jgi:uroporphyrinogen-III synthase
VTLPLSGYRIALPESRELDLFARMLEERGAETLRCPLVTIVDSPDTEAVTAWIRRCCEQPFDDLVLLTGEGLKRLLGFAERAGLEAPFIEALGKTRTITRGPKPGRALRDIGLRPLVQAESPTTAGVIATLEQLDLQGHRVGVQLYGEEPNLPLMQAIEAAGASADPVAPYRYTADIADPRVLQLLDALGGGAVDAIAFTSKAQVERLYSVAEATGRRDELDQSLRKVLVATVGPVATDYLAAQGIQADLQPESSFFMKPLVREIVAHRERQQAR